jgi:hypothetical protein
LKFVPGVVNRIICWNVIEMRVGAAVRSVEHIENIPERYLAGFTGEFVAAKRSSRASDESGAVKGAEHLM